jgi:HlyD family secretion protein
MKKIGKILLGVTVVAGLIGGGIWYSKQRAAQNPEQRYKLLALEKGDVTQTVSANGTLNPVVLVSVGTQVSGTVKKLYVDFNDHVKKGQALLELDDALVSATERQSAASVANAQATLELAQANEARIKQLFAQEYVSKQEFDQSRQALKSAQAQLALARAQNDRDKANLNFTVIRSPVDGVVIDRVVDLGQTVAASFQTPVLIKIAQDLSEMRIDTSFAEADIGSSARRSEGQVYGRRLPEPQFHGRRTTNSPQSDQSAKCGDVQRAYQRRQSGTGFAAGDDGLRKYCCGPAQRCPAGAERGFALQAGGCG